jgi:hypothetical protein
MTNFLVSSDDARERGSNGIFIEGCFVIDAHDFFFHSGGYVDVT